jgi:hypothetical protein
MSGFQCYRCRVFIGTIKDLVKHRKTCGAPAQLEITNEEKL